jgi:hypothetical protein
MKSGLRSLAAVALLMFLVILSSSVSRPQDAPSGLIYWGQWAGYYNLPGPSGTPVRCQMILQLSRDGKCFVLFGPENSPLQKEAHALSRRGSELLLFTPPRDLSPTQKAGVFVSRLSFSKGGKNARLQTTKVTYSDAQGKRREKALQDITPVIELERLSSQTKELIR